jgi:hypothetical protein
MDLPIGRLAFAVAMVVPVSGPLYAGSGALARGTWGGDRVILEVVAEGADVEFECARGRIDTPIELDAKGEFDLPGTFGAEGRGPARDGVASAARYRGHVEGDTMTLNVTVDGKEGGPYTLTRDRQSVLRKCR